MISSLRIDLRARLFVEHLEDRAQPALISTSPLLQLPALDPVSNSAPALVSNSSFPAPSAPGAAAPAASEATLVIFFGPADAVEFAILIEPAQTVSVPPTTTTTNRVTESLLSETTLREFLSTGDFRGVIETISIVPLSENHHPSQPGPLPPVAPSIGAQPMLFVATQPYDALSTFLTPAGYLLATRNIALAPLPHEVEIRLPLEIAPPPREVQPGAILPVPSTEQFVAAVGADEALTLDTDPVFKPWEAPPATAVENLLEVEDQPPAANVSWGWFGALAMAISAGGYWMLHHSGIAHEAKHRTAKTLLLKWTDPRG